MTEIAIITPAFDDWLAQGKTLAGQRRSLDWMIGDWMIAGRQSFEAEQFDLGLSQIIADDRAIRRIERTARAFPPHLRDNSLSFDHHAHVADMPVQEALPLLKLAHDEHLSPRELRVQAMLRKVDIGQIIPREADAEDDALMALVRAWNRAPLMAREDFAEMIRESSGGLIEFTPGREDA